MPTRSIKASLTGVSAVLLTGVALAACGGDDETNESSETTGATATSTAPAPTDTAPATETERTETVERPETDTAATTTTGGGSPEDQEGGAGDEIPASSQVLITGRNGRLGPKTVHVAPFIAIKVQLRSADGVQYELSGGGRDVAAGGEIETASTTFDGLRTGERLVLSGPQGRVVIEADAEPGP